MFGQSWVTAGKFFFGDDTDITEGDIMREHERRMSSDDPRDERYKEIYAASQTAAWLYGAGYTDPVGGAIGFQHVGEGSQFTEPVNWSANDQGVVQVSFPDIEKWEQSRELFFNEMTNYYSNPQNIGVANDLRLFAPSIRIEDSGQMTWVGWQFLVWTP